MFIKLIVFDSNSLYHITPTDGFLITVVIIQLFWEFFTLELADGFSWEFKWQQVSSRLLKFPRLFLVVLADLNNAVIWMVFTCLRVPLPILWGLFHVHQPQLVSPSRSLVLWPYACHVTLLWSWFCDKNLRFRVVGSSTLSVPTLCLKNPLMGDDTIYLGLLQTVQVVRWSKLPRCWQLKDKKNSRLTINNYLLKHNGVAIIYTIYT